MVTNTTETIGGGQNETIKEEVRPTVDTRKSMKTSFLKITNVNGGRDKSLPPLF